MVRLLLEQAGRFEQYRQSYRALLRKTGVCCYLYTIKMHLFSRRPQGCVRNLKNLHRSLRFFLSDGFSPRANPDDLAEVVEMPGELEKDYDYIR